jgi:glycosyltransferase involved in cell wall biosynthesis
MGARKLPIKLSVIIPAHNEERYIGMVLRALSTLGSTSNIETIVVDAGSKDKTRSISQELGASVLSIGQVPPGRARNFGAKHASAEFLAFIDGDVVVTADWMDAVTDLLARKRELSGSLRGAPYVTRPDGGWLEKHWFSSTGRRTRKYINGGNLLISKADFDRLGGFDERLTTGEDVDLCSRAGKAGLAIEIDPRFKAIHLGYPRSWWEFLAREAWHGSGDAVSVDAFLNSKIAQAAVVNLLLLLMAALAVVIGEFLVAGVLVLVSLGLAAGLSARERGLGSGFSQVILGIPVAFVYLIGRAAGIVLPPKLLARLRNQAK